MKKAMLIQNEDSSGVVYGPDQLRRMQDLVDVQDGPVTGKEAGMGLDRLGDVELIFSTWGMCRLDEEFLRLVPRLEAVFYAAGSIKNFSTKAMWERGVRVCSAAPVNAVPVAEWCLGVILLSLKSSFRHADAFKRTHRWLNQTSFPMPGAYRSKVGLISFGGVARHLTALLRNFDIDVWVYSIDDESKAEAEFGFQQRTIEEIFAECDVVSLHTALLPETKGMIGRELLTTMKPGATLINSARGGLIRQPELVEILRERSDLMAVLDVTDPEPPDPEDPLLLLPNVMVTPHISGSVQNECQRMADAMLDECERYLKGEDLRYEVRAEALHEQA